MKNLEKNSKKKMTRVSNFINFKYYMRFEINAIFQNKY